ncbi:fimbrial chaperone [Enterobacter hormaechei]|uniref:fimbrial chaperone n=1 Tax=Enterobacter hormaechei TaxID=158836 RepID=UPI00298A86BC|nr:fimbrial chaperone [Enterobacter hormaechei]HBL5174781.1 fimbrial chaperone [Enterobacter hormaechei]HBL6014418.1 fimbrial chaperone [Enterobacter hormaechei]HBL6128039.1 fimbrial chaperone [Enterobacter hormaechei]HBL8994501.1 fimbrial chaperone [Enterobacter hormaechei]
MPGRIAGLLLAVCITSFSTSVPAGVIIGGTRVIYSSDKPDATITIKNNEASIPYLIQSWVDPFHSDSASGKPPFTVIPPVSRLDAGQEKVLRIMKVQGTLPQDRESVFWLNIKNIPPASDKPNSLEIAIKTRIKLFWRPANLNTTPERAATKVKWHIQNRKLIVENPTPLHINVMNVTVDGKDVPLNIVQPFATLTLPLPEGVNGHALVWRYVNDFGAISQDINVAL